MNYTTEALFGSGLQQESVVTKPEKEKAPDYSKYWTNWKQENREKMIVIAKDGKVITVDSGDKGRVGLSLKKIDQLIKEQGLGWGDIKEIVHNHNSGEAPSPADTQAYKAMMAAGFGGNYLIYTPKTGQVRNVPIGSVGTASISVERKPLPPADKIPPGATFVGYDKQGYPKYKLPSGKVIRWKD